MFRNIGSKLKALAYVNTILGMIVSIIYGIQNMPAGIFAIALGCLISWTGSFVMYGLGHVVENSEKLLKLMESPASQADTDSAAVAPIKAERAPWACVTCGTENRGSVGYCVSCGTNRDWSEDRHKKQAQKLPGE